MLQLDLQQVIAQALGFVILLVILRRFAWKPLLGVLDSRRARIEDQMRQMAQSKSEMVRLHEEVSQRLAKIDDEARMKIQQAILEGKRIALEIQEQAREEAKGIIDKSKETIALELAKAKVTLRDDLAQMTVDALEKLLQGKVDAKTDQHLVEAILDELQRSEHA